MRKYVLITIMYFFLFKIGYDIFELTNHETNRPSNNLGSYAALISSVLAAFGCFWELYITKKKLSND